MASKYFDNILRIPLFTAKTKEQNKYLMKIYMVRNIIVHDNSRMIHIISENRKEKIKEIASSGDILRIENDLEGNIVIRAEFLKTAHERVTIVIEDLIKRTREKYPLSP